ncbi:tyrosine-type recombinase/integrase [Nocardioides sambongensis]|uniref:tyrosine-type recombinase/integrase n=1 Tax=Nocardioides sambongensis TaxID=2589074 RepID=UPI00112C41AB|nr:site-specific integrase [Nocardioides sambongensis]
MASTGKTKFGTTRKLPSGRYQARYTGPDGIRRKAPVTFDTLRDAETWLATVRADIVRDVWVPSKQTAPDLTFGEYADAWLAGRTLKARTRAHYRKLLDQQILPTFAATTLKTITPDSVRAWHAVTATDRPTLRSHAYGLLRTILGQAERDDLIGRNPCHIRGAGNAKRVHKVEPATLGELEHIVTAMPQRYQLLVLLAAWCGLRFGELTELRRGDVDTRKGVLRIRRGVVRADGETLVTTPKSDAGIRDVSIPPHLLPLVREHLLQHAAPGRDGLLFPARSGGHLAPASLYRVYYPARAQAGRPDLRFHDLRHTGAVLAASTGATLAELMGRLGHSTPGAALRYQHAAQGRDAAIAEALSRLAQGTPPQ